MRKLRSRTTIGALALVVAVTLAGCEEDDGPGSAPPPDSPSVPETSSPTEPTTAVTETGPVEPTLPVEAEADTKAGVEAFVTFYWEIVNYATKTGDVDLLARLDQPSCDTCDAAIDGIERIYGRKGRIVGGDYEVIRLESARSGASHWAVVTTTKIARQRTIGAGSLNGTFPGGRAKWLVGVAFIQGEWSVSTLERR